MTLTSRHKKKAWSGRPPGSKNNTLELPQSLVPGQYGIRVFFFFADRSANLGGTGSKNTTEPSDTKAGITGE